MYKFWLLLIGLLSAPLAADQVQVAVASNFYQPMKALTQMFEASSGHKVQLSAGSTGSLFAQIKNGAPFEVFLAADQRRPSTLIEAELALASSQFTYAEGQLVLWSSHPQKVDVQGKVLFSSSLQQLALANPKTAPYGVAAIEVLKQLGRYNELRSKLVQGKNISQTYQFVSTGAVQQGFVAMSQVYRQGQLIKGSAWVVPNHLYSPLNQDAVLLQQGASNPAARAFLTFLKSEQAQTLIRSFGYRCQNES